MLTHHKRTYNLVFQTISEGTLTLPDVKTAGFGGLPEDVIANFSTTCLFLGHRTSSNRVRLRLLQGFLGRTVAKAELQVADLGHCAPWMEFHPELRDTKNSDKVLGSPADGV